MKYIFTILLLSFTCTVLLSQISTVDSLNTIIQNTDSETEKINLLNDLADEYKRLGDLDEMFRYANLGAKESLNSGFTEGQIRSFLLLGLYHELTGSLDQSFDYYYEALGLSRANNDLKNEVISLNHISSIHRDQENWDIALQNSANALKICQNTGDELGIAMCLFENANVFSGMRKYREALDSFTESLAIYTDYGDHAGQIKNHLGISRLFANLDDYDKALYHLDRIQKINQKTGNTEYLIEVLMRKGKVYRMKAEYQTSLGLFKEAVGSIESEKDSLLLSEILNEMGSISLHTGRTDSALIYFSKALKSYQELGLENKAGKVYQNIADIYNQMGMLGLALEHYKEAVTIFEQVETRSGLADAKMSIGMIYLQSNEGDKAIECLQMSAQISKETGPKRKYAEILKNIGIYHRSFGQSDSALFYFNKSLDLSSEIRYDELLAELYTELGIIYKDRSKFNLAIENLTDGLGISRTIGDVRQNCIALLELYNLYTIDQGKTIDPIQYLNASGNNSFEDMLLVAKDLSLNLKSTDLITRCHLSLIDYYKASNSTSSALMYSESLNLHLDSVANYETDRILSTIMSKYEFAQKDKEIEILTKDKEIQQLAIDQQITIRNTLIIGSILLFLFALGLLNRFLFVKKTNKIIRKERERVEMQKRRAIESENFKQRFLATMSHEIRTPLNVIVGVSRILQRNKKLKEQEQHLDAISSSSGNLLSVINDVLDISKLEAGKMEMVSVPFNLKVVVNDTINILRFKAEERGIQLNSAIAQDVPIHLKGDSARLGQILINIIGNAIKFTEKGSVSLQINQVSSTNGDITLKFSITDTGIGIPQDKIDTIFENFIQSDSNISRKYGGSGLGLSISRRLIDLLGGKINVNSEVGAGSTFELYIPYPLCKIEIDHSIGGHVPIPDLEGLSILLVEDNPFNAMVAKDELFNLLKDVSIDEAENGRIATGLIEQNNYDVILMDVEMPEMNGYEATAFIRNMPSIKSETPVIAMTARVMKAEIELCFRSGMNDYIAKPFDPDTLLFKIYNQVRDKHINREAV